jgi:hypothetical protein
VIHVFGVPPATITLVVRARDSRLRRSACDDHARCPGA